MIVGKFTKRMRCSCQGCRNHATWGIGKKASDFVFCDEHFKILCDEVVGIVDEFNKAKAEADKKIAEEKKKAKAQAKAEAKAKALEEDALLAEETPAVEEEIPGQIAIETPHEFFTCKYCGEQFDKAETTTQQFMAHCRKCKKEHEE